VAGVFAVVLTEGSAGESADVRRVEALALPVDGATIAPAVVAEGFHAEGGELRASRDAAQSVLGGSGLTRLLTLWLVWGRRPYPRWLSWLLTVGWGVVGALIVLLLAAPDPGSRLEPMGLSLLTLWGTLVAIGVAVAGRVLYQGWRAGRALATGSGGLELRLRMSDGLRLMGGSAGLPLTLNALAAILRAQHRTATGAWIWTRLHRGVRAHGAHWAATGIVGSDGTISAVALEPKLRACLQHDSVEHLLTPRQLEARRGIVARTHESLLARGHAESMRSAATPGDTRRLGFAAERRSLRSHACRHVADAVLTVAGLRDRRQLAIGALAMLASLVMLAALPDLRNILLPPPAPMIIATTGSSPFSLAITLDAPDADAFIVALESRFWANRREPLHRSGKTSRADVPLHRLAQRVMWELDDGTVWVERRRRFLFHEFAPGERVGAYSLRYMNQLNK
jgi:hypothetical protein